ncbi:MAG: hypothetical protein AAFN17_08340 [Pseudomonadota bacterium]
MHDLQQNSPAISQLKRYGQVSSTIGGAAATIGIILFCAQQYMALTGLALTTIALQILALAVLFLPSFLAFRGELRDGSVHVEEAQEKAAFGKPPLWLILVMLAILAVHLVGLFLSIQSGSIGIFFVFFVFVLVYTRGWPTFETQAQQASGAAGLGMAGLMLSMIPAMMAGGYMARSGIIDVPEGVGLLGFAALMVLPAGFVFFSTITVIGRARNAH